MKKGKAITQKIIKDSLATVAGAFLCAFSLYSFIIPNAFVSGGVGGIATILENAGIIKAYISQLLMNIPLLIAALIWLRKDFALKTIACSLLITLFMGMMEKFGFFRFTSDRLLAAFYSGVLYGVALGMLFESGGSSGGSEIIANLVVKFNPEAKVSKLILLMDVAVIIAGLTIFDGWSVAYAVVCSFACERTMAFYLGRAHMFGSYYIVTTKPEGIKEKFNEKFKREGLQISAIGSTTGGEKTLLQIFLPAANSAKVKDILESTDKETFSFIVPSGEANGGKK